MTSWVKVPPVEKRKAPPHWLEMRTGKFGTSYRVRYRRDGIKIEEVLHGEFERWEDARKMGEALIAKLKYGDRPKPRNLVTTESLCNEIVELKKAKDPSTYEQAEIFFRVHIKPFLIEACPYASELNPTVWLRYKSEFRLKYPTRPLFNHWKFFGQLFKTAHEKGIIPKTKLEYNQNKDDNRELGKVIPSDHLQAFLREANKAWTDRAKLQRLTGQRPGVIRELKKEAVDFERGVASVRKAESKNRRNYEFKLPSAALDILRKRLDNGSPYFFPSEADKAEPMDKHLGGWHSAWKRAGIQQRYTPHDIRHTFLTDKVNTAGTNLAVLCYSCDLSLEELMKTYVHFKAEDTQSLADDSDKKAQIIFGEMP